MSYGRYFDEFFVGQAFRHWPGRTITEADNPVSMEIPSIEITELGMIGFNAASNRTAIGLAVNFPQFRYVDTYQVQNNVTMVRNNHLIKAGFDVRREYVKSFFFPTIRGLLRYPTLDAFVNDVDLDDVWWGEREGQFALALLERPGDQVAQALWQHWDLLTSPGTTLERLGELVGMQPPPHRPTAPEVGGPLC